MFLVPNSSLAARNLIVNVFFRYFMRYQRYEVIDNSQSQYLLLYCSSERLGLGSVPHSGLWGSVLLFVSSSVVVSSGPRASASNFGRTRRMGFVSRSWHHLSIFQLFLTAVWCVFPHLTLLILLVFSVRSNRGQRLPRSRRVF